MFVFNASFIGVSQSLPRTAYIKLIDVWMIFTMFYPFSVVTLYAVHEFLQEGDSNIPVALVQEKRRLMRRRTTRFFTFLLYRGLPLLAITFIILFWFLGFSNTGEIELNNNC